MLSCQEGALTAFRKTYDKTVALGHRLDIVFYLLRIGLFYMDNDLITRNIEKAKRYRSLTRPRGQAAQKGACGTKLVGSGFEDGF